MARAPLRPLDAHRPHLELGDLGLRVEGRVGQHVGRAILHGQKLVHGQPGCADDSPDGSFRQLPRMIGNRGAPPRHRMEPDLVTALRLAIEDEAGAPQASDHVGGGEACQSPHQAATAMRR